MNQASPAAVSVNGRTYPWPGAPAIAICLDGCEPAYLDAAIRAGLMLTLKRIRGTGTEVMMNDVRFLRAPTVFKGFYDAGARARCCRRSWWMRCRMVRNS